MCHKGGKHHEGDMILTDNQTMALMTSEYNASDYRWPNATVAVQLNGTFSIDQTTAIWEAFNEIQSVSCVRFVNQTDESNFVRITVCIDIHLKSIHFSQHFQRVFFNLLIRSQRTMDAILK